MGLSVDIDETYDIDVCSLVNDEQNSCCCCSCSCEWGCRGDMVVHNGDEGDANSELYLLRDMEGVLCRLDAYSARLMEDMDAREYARVGGEMGAGCVSPLSIDAMI